MTTYDPPDPPEPRYPRPGSIRGSWIVAEECERCEGSGCVEALDEITQEEGWIICPKCEGSGVVEVEDMPERED
jgi:DnaJ-class molecular chaperone